MVKLPYARLNMPSIHVVIENWSQFKHTPLKFDPSSLNLFSIKADVSLEKSS
jgi:hypothetical protein